MINNNNQIIDPGMNYRLLDECEKIEKGDECSYDFGKSWEPIMDGMENTFPTEWSASCFRRKFNYSFNKGFEAGYRKGIEDEKKRVRNIINKI